MLWWSGGTYTSLVSFETVAVKAKRSKLLLVRRRAWVVPGHHDHHCGGHEGDDGYDDDGDSDDDDDHDDHDHDGGVHDDDGDGDDDDDVIT